MRPLVPILFLFLGAALSCPKYNRDAQYGPFIHWGDCQDTRAKVLIRDSKTKVSFTGTKTCVVDSGLWIDPYSGESLRSAGDIQIDHMVPLNEAHKSGAWAWTLERRKAYTNFLDSSYHLLAVKGSLNSSKGDRDPASWLPPDTSYRYQYALNWVKIKSFWGLKADSAELRALHELLHGSDSMLVYPILAPEDICTDTGVVAVLIPRPPSSRLLLAPDFHDRFFNGKFNISGRKL